MSDVLGVAGWVIVFLVWLAILLFIAGAVLGVNTDTKKKAREDKLNSDIARNHQALDELARLRNPHHISDPTERAKASKAIIEWRKRTKR